MSPPVPAGIRVPPHPGTPSSQQTYQRHLNRAEVCRQCLDWVAAKQRELRARKKQGGTP